MKTDVVTKNDVVRALKVTAEITSTDLSESAVAVMLADLSTFNPAEIVGALARCRRELRGRLTVASIIERLDDGRPGPNEAWAMIPKTEDGSVVWTQEMAEAYGVAAPLIDERGNVAARVAFIETYNALVAKARDERRPAKWTPSLGQNAAMREAAVHEAVRKHRLLPHHAARLLPSAPVDAKQLADLTAPARAPMPAFVRNAIKGARS